MIHEYETGMVLTIMGYEGEEYIKFFYRHYPRIPSDGVSPEEPEHVDITNALLCGENKDISITEMLMMTLSKESLEGIEGDILDYHRNN